MKTAKILILPLIVVIEPQTFPSYGVFLILPFFIPNIEQTLANGADGDRCFFSFAIIPDENDKAIAPFPKAIAFP